MLAACSGGTMSRTIARLSTMPEAAVAPTSRNARNAVMLGASMQPTVAARKMASEPSSTGRRP